MKYQEELKQHELNEKMMHQLSVDIFDESPTDFAARMQVSAKSIARRVGSGMYLKNYGDYENGKEVELSFPRKALTILCARTGGGKTTEMLNVSVRMAMAGKTGAFISLEEPVVKLYTKAMAIYECLEIGTDNAATANKMLQMVGKDGGRNWPLMQKFKKEVISRLKMIDGNSDALSETSADPSVLYDPAALSYVVQNENANRIRNHKPVLDFLMVDYAQLMKAEDATDNGVMNIKRVMQSVRNLCGQNDLAVIMGAQLNRTADTIDFENWTPSMLREGADIEFTANQIVAMTKVYNTENMASYHMRLLKNRDANPMQEGVFGVSFRHQFIESRPTMTREVE